jgi:hypothetical protein
MTDMGRLREDATTRCLLASRVARVGCVAHDLSLLRFLQTRLSEDIDLIIKGTPMFGLEVNNPEFERRFLDRVNLLDRVRTDQVIFAMTASAMQDEQGSPPARASSFEGGPVTTLGSNVLKSLAGRYSDHPDYRLDW